jgi:hypothetical protein
VEVMLTPYRWMNGLNGDSDNDQSLYDTISECECVSR